MRRRSVSPSVPGRRRGASASPTGLVLSRIPRVKPWKGPLPPRRVSATPAIGFFVKAAFVRRGLGDPVSPPSAEVAASCGPADEVAATEPSWRAVARRLRAAWGCGSESGRMG